MPKTDVEWSITPNGHLKVSWLKKIATYQEQEPVELTILDLESGSVRNFGGVAEEVGVPSLRLGAKYEVVLVEIASGEEYGPIIIEACEYIYIYIYISRDEVGQDA